MVKFKDFLQARRSEVQVFVDVLMIIVASCVFIPLGQITNGFDGNCLLNSNIFLEKSVNGVIIDLKYTTYDKGSDCDFTTYSNVIVAIHSLVWIWFFIHVSALKRVNGSIINILLPAIVCRVVFLIVIISSTIKISSGFTMWCQNIEEHLRERNMGDIPCSDTQDLPWERPRSSFYTFSVIATIFSWFLVIVQLVSIGVTFIHLYSDFLETMAAELKEIEEYQKEDGYSRLEGDDNASNISDFYDEGGAKNGLTLDSHQVDVHVDSHKSRESPKDVARVRNRTNRDI